MIIQIRGTSGSGKSTAMRTVMERMGDWNSEHVEGRKRPLLYRSASEWSSTVVLGHYESPCGGCDTIGSAGKVAELIARVRGTCDVVLCEGLLLSEDTKWSRGIPGLRVVFLTTSLERCLENIRSRRLRDGNDSPLDPGNTSRRVAVIERARVKLTESGVRCCRCSADQAPGVVLRWISEVNPKGRNSTSSGSARPSSIRTT